MHLDEHFIRSAIPEVSLIQPLAVKGMLTFSIDSRTLQEGDIFIALEGSQQDGHNFIVDAIQKGARGIIINHHKKSILNSTIPTNLGIFTVPDTFKALLHLAKNWRKQFTYPIVAITGSVGKTSTKTILGNILDAHDADYFISSGTQNTFIGLALNLLKLRSHYEMAIFEVGIDRRNEMMQKVELLQPTTALITCIGHAHMQGLGSVVDIAAEKRAIFSLFKEDNIGVINGDQQLLAGISYPHPIIKFGTKTTNQIQARKVTIDKTGTINFLLKIYGQKYTITLPSNHTGALFNALAATAMAHLLKIPDDTIIRAIQQPVMVAGRYEHRKLKSGKGIIINDCYNASPESMKAALLALQTIDTQAQKIAVLGDMLELGINSPFWHRQLGRFLRKVPSLKQVILVGDMVQWTKKTLPVNVTVELVPTWQDAVTMLKTKLTAESIILVKGSRGMKLNYLVDAMCQEESANIIAESQSVSSAPLN